MIREEAGHSDGRSGVLRGGGGPGRVSCASGATPGIVKRARARCMQSRLVSSCSVTEVLRRRSRRSRGNFSRLLATSCSNKFASPWLLIFTLSRVSNAIIHTREQRTHRNNKKIKLKKNRDLVIKLINAAEN
ncbi:hypothetical protein PUN28_017559 [Cardiocondyla obscurior]|uniref:Ribosomal protein S20 n=1 Tax=Cardiocondyla obscurior TaxID=286306 RepID=A0AAW2EI28_9HYME